MHPEIVPPVRRRISTATLLVISAVAAMLGACDTGTGVGLGRGISVVSATLTDTVYATHPLSIAVRDSAGRIAPRAVVEFDVPQDPDPFVQFRMDVAPLDSQLFRFRTSDTTDGLGHVTVQARFAFTAGPAELLIRVPELGLVDTVRFTIRPGNATGVRVAPNDTAIYASHSFTLRAHAVDQFGNRRDEPVDFSVAYGPVTANATSGAVVATTVGRAAVVARSAGLIDTAYVSVVPPAWVATQKFDPGNGGPQGLFLMQLDGSGRDSLAPGLDNSFIPQGFGWSPDGRQLALARGRTITLLTPGGGEQPLVEMTGDLNTATRFSRDGAWVYFALAYGSATQPQGLYRVKVDGTGLEQLGQAGSNYFVSPSNDGLSVAYVSDRTPCGVESCIRVLDVATNQDRVYGTQDFLARGSMPAWSPTSDLIAYTSGSNLVLAHANGTGSVVLANDMHYVKWLDWSPDGHWLLVAETGVILFEVQTGLRLPMAQFLSYGATAWRP